MGHVALVVPDIDASVSWATTVMGMREVERVDGVSYLTHADCHHSLMYIDGSGGEAQLDHVAMEAHDDNALDALVARLGEHGVELSADSVEEKGIGRAVRF